MRGKSIAVVLRQVCSKSGLEEGARHTYLVHGEVLVGEVEKLLGDRCCYSTGAGAGAAVDFVVGFDENVAVGVDGLWPKLGGFAVANAHHQTWELGRKEH
jgi:hypothetical protein